MTISRYPNTFNFFTKPLCEAKIVPDLGTSAIEALMKSSWSTRQIFTDEMKLRKNAHIILNEVMNGTPDSVKAELENMKKIYGNNIWKLLLAKTTGVENHCDRHWSGMNAIVFAAWSGDFIHHQVPRVANTYLLNLLLTYIPEEHRHLVIEQLQQLKINGTEHGAVLAGFYKMSALKNEEGKWEHKIKLSEQEIKISNPGRHQVRRFFSNGNFVADVIYDLDIGIPEAPDVTLLEPALQQMHINDYDASVDLLEPLYRKGKLVQTPKSIHDTRAEALKETQAFAASYINKVYPVGLEKKLHEVKIGLMRKYRKI